MTFVIFSAVCGEMWSASVRLPRQPQGRRHSIHHKPRRYTTKLVASHAMSPSANCRAFANTQTHAMTSSTIPTASIKCLNCIPVIGSAAARSLMGANALQVFATPVTATIAPAVETNHAANTALFRHSKPPPTTAATLFIATHDLENHRSAGFWPVSQTPAFLNTNRTPQSGHGVPYFCLGHSKVLYSSCSRYGSRHMQLPNNGSCPQAAAHFSEGTHTLS
jgi:hypothetical protein